MKSSKLHNEVYIKLKIENRMYNGGTIRARATFRLDEITSKKIYAEVKIDTGCDISVIPLVRLKKIVGDCNKLKEAAINCRKKWYTAYGVETGWKEHEVIRTKEDLEKCEAANFRHSITDFQIERIPISQKFISVNYNRGGNILIGMDILKDWDIHIGRDRNGESYFLACPYDLISDDYCEEIQGLFSIKSMVESTTVRNRLETEGIDMKKLEQEEIQQSQQWRGQQTAPHLF